MGWTPNELGNLNGRCYAITGGNSGLGLEAAKILCGKGARVVITARSEAKASGAIEAIRSAVPGAETDFVLLDLSDSSSVVRAIEELRARCPKLDAVINNAGVMQTPEVRTAEGWELQLATNHLGHFRLNAGLFPNVEAAGGRIVVVSSIAHKFGKIHLHNLMLDQDYDPTVAYGQSKLANLMYALELQRRLDARGSAVKSVACHPGYAATNLQSAGVGMDGGSKFFQCLYALTNRFFAQSAEEGAYPLVLAAADPSARGGAYYGPTGLSDARGPVGEATISPRALQEDVATKLWEKTEELVGPFFA